MLNPFRKPALAEVAARELEQAQHSLLEAQTAQEYAASVISYNEARIKRLKAFLRTQEASNA